jgi:glutaredoxin
MSNHRDSKRCLQHDLALAPDGTCTLCRRDPQVRDGLLRGSSAVLGAPGWLVVAALTLFVGSGVSRALQVLRAHYQPPMAASSSAEAPSAVRITMYSTRWCGVCTRARTYMQQNGIPFSDFDVEHDAAAGARLRQLNPRGSVPTIAIEDEVLIGFSADALKSAIDRSAQRLKGS